MTAAEAQSEAIYAVIAERSRQEQKWGSSITDGTKGSCANPLMSNELRLAVLAEEFGEVAKAMLEGDDVGREVTQVAAVALAWAEGLILSEEGR